MDLGAFLQQHPFLAATLMGLLTAVRIDYQAFEKFKSYTEAAAYDWKVARWRWFHGAVTGLGSALLGDSVIRHVAGLF